MSGAFQPALMAGSDVPAIALVSFSIGLAEEMLGMPTRVAEAIERIGRLRDNPDTDLARLSELGGYRAHG